MNPVMIEAARLEQIFELCCRGHSSCLTDLTRADAEQAIAFIVTKLCQLWLEIEMRTRI